MKNEKIVAFGEIMLRLSAPNGVATADCTAFDGCYGGTEANVLACLAKFGHSVKYVTALPDNGLGDGAKKHLESFGIDTSDIIIGGDTLGVYFAESGSGSRGANVIYYRRGSEVAKLNEDAFDYDKVFAGAKLFHISGISFALSESSRQLAFRLLEEAKARGIKISFDFNYRAKLWTIDEARDVFLCVLPYADIVLASKLDLDAFLSTDIGGYFDRYNTEYLILRNRTVVSKTRHSVNVTAVHNADGFIEKAEIPKLTFDVSERVGGGDAFDGGVLHILANGGSIADAVRFGVGAFVLKHGISGDTFTADETQVNATLKKLFG